MNQEVEIAIHHKDGLHLRPAGMFVQKAASYTADIQIRNVTKDSGYQNAKSAINVMMLKVSDGDTIAIKAEGDDAQEAIVGLLDLINSGFPE